MQTAVRVFVWPDTRPDESGFVKFRFQQDASGRYGIDVEPETLHEVAYQSRGSVEVGTYEVRRDGNSYVYLINWAASTREKVIEAIGEKLTIAMENYCESLEPAAA